MRISLLCKKKTDMFISIKIYMLEISECHQNKTTCVAGWLLDIHYVLEQLTLNKDRVIKKNKCCYMWKLVEHNSFVNSKS